MITLAGLKPTRLIRFMVLLLVCLFVFGIPFGSAEADIGPKPSMSFEFIYKTDVPLIITSGIQLQCQDPDCLNASPFDDDGRQLLTCTATRCGSVAFGYAKYHRLVITFSDGITRESNTFGKRNFEAKYKVIVWADDLEVSEKLWGFNPTNIMLFGGFGALFIFALMIAGLLVILGLFIRNARRGTISFEDAYGLYSITWIIAVFIGIFGSLVSLTILATIVIEAVVGFLYTLIRKLPRLRFLTMILLANLITQPLLLVTLSATEGIVSTQGLTIVLEIVIWLVEALILFFTMRDQFRLIESLGVSFLLNGASILAGFILAI